MKLSVDEIKMRVKAKKDAAADYLNLVPKWEQLWLLDPGFTQELKDSIEKDGREQVKTSDPYNAIQLAQRLIATQPKIDIPPAKDEHECILKAQKKERFLLDMWQRMNQLQGRNVLQDMAWNILVRGRSVVEVKWVREDLPPGQTRFPINIRTLEPKNAFVHQGPLYPEYGFHEYKAKRVDIKQNYPRYKFEDDSVDGETEKCTVIDFWWMNSKTGKYWNAVLIDDDFAKKPTATDYTFLPIIVVYGEGGDTNNEAYRGLSLIHPLVGQWEAKCRNLSNMATGALWASWPFYAVSNDQGRETPDITVRPGTTANLPPGTKIDQILPQVNMTAVQGILNALEDGIAKATFPPMMYGDTASVQSGYGIGLVNDSAAGRVRSQIEALELQIMMVNEGVMRLIDAFDDEDEGIVIWGRDERNREMYSLQLTKDDIQEYYENLVKLRLQTPQDDTQRTIMGSQLVDKGYISEETFRDDWLPLATPTDERQRVLAEQALKAQGVLENTQILALMKMYPQSWRDIIAGTPLEQQADAIMESRVKRQEPEPSHIMPDGTMMPGAEHPAGPPPDMMGPPPGAMPPMPPMPPPGPPPGMMPPGPPPGPPQPGMQMDPLLAGPQGGGVPPQLAGQITPEMLGMMAEQDPMLFQQLMQGPENIPPAELQALLERGRQ